MRSNYEEIQSVLKDLGIEKADGIYLDLGVSSYQLDTPERGFTYREDDAPLDMRMDQRNTQTAADIVNTYSEFDLYRIIRDYGEDKFAKNIAKHIVLSLIHIWVIDRKVDVMKEEGISFVTGADVGKNHKAKDILKDFDRVILACGASNPRDIQVPGRDSEGIYFAVDFLKSTTKSLLNSNLKDQSNLSAKGKHVIVIGGGDPGNDCVGTAIRQLCIRDRV